MKNTGFRLVTLAALALLIGGGCRNISTPPVEESGVANVAQSDENTEVTQDEILPEEKKQVVRSGSYEDYAPEKLAFANNGSVVLFFHAPWCPTCRSANSNFKSANMPDGLTILKVSYDTETELKKKYGVTYQHTFVQVDAEGNLIKKWGSSQTVDQIVAKINS